MSLVSPSSPTLTPAQAALHDAPEVRAIRVLRTAKAELREMEVKLLDAATSARGIISAIEDEIGKLRDSVFEEKHDG